MTISSIIPVNNYAGNLSNTKFDFDFLIEDEKELVVQHCNSQGIINILKYGVDYSINEIGNKNGSYILFPLETSLYNVLSTDEKISLALSLQIKQESEFHNSSHLSLDVLEWTFDYIVRVLQILNRKLERCVKVEELISISPDEIINSLNDKYKKVHYAYSQIVDLSKIVEDNKEFVKQEALNAKENADIAVQKAKDAGMIIGQCISMYCSEKYLPESCLPCDGEEYSANQFQELWDNFLTSKNPIVTINDNVVMGTIDGLLAPENKLGVLSNFKMPLNIHVPKDNLNNLYGDFVINFITGEDIVTEQFLACSNIFVKDGGTADIRKIYIMNGELFAESVESASICTIVKIYPNRMYSLKYSKAEESGFYNVYLLDEKEGTTITLATSRKLESDTLFFASFFNEFLGNIDLNNSYYTDELGNAVKLANVDRNTLLLAVSYSDYEKEIAQNGQCSCFGVDLETAKFRVPFLKNGTIIQQALNSEKIGCSQNISISTNQNPAAQIGAVTLRHFVVVADGQKNQAMINWETFVNDLKSKVNTDLSNVLPSSGFIRLIDFYSNGIDYYKIYEETNPDTGEKRKWCKQGSSTLMTSEYGINVTIPLFVPYQSDDYNIFCSIQSDSPDGSTLKSSADFVTKTTESFSIYPGHKFKKSWFAEGYIS